MAQYRGRSLSDRPSFARRDRLQKRSQARRRERRRRDDESLFHPFGFGFEHVFCEVYKFPRCTSSPRRHTRAESLVSTKTIAQAPRGCKRNCHFGNTLKASVAAMQRRDKILSFQDTPAP